MKNQKPSLTLLLTTVHRARGGGRGWCVGGLRNRMVHRPNATERRSSSSIKERGWRSATVHSFRQVTPEQARFTGRNNPLSTRLRHIAKLGRCPILVCGRKRMGKPYLGPIASSDSALAMSSAVTRASVLGTGRDARRETGAYPKVGQLYFLESLLQVNESPAPAASSRTPTVPITLRFLSTATFRPGASSMMTWSA